jgi:hypothetical protein
MQCGCRAHWGKGSSHLHSFKKPFLNILTEKGPNDKRESWPKKGGAFTPTGLQNSVKTRAIAPKRGNI